MTSIPAFHVSGPGKARGKGLVFIASRKDAVSTGIFSIDVNVQFGAADAYPAGAVRIKADLTDSLKAVFVSTSIELVNSHGKHTPTIFLTGRCKTTTERAPKGLRYWVMIADNSRDGREGTADIAGFVIHDRKGDRIAYGTGPVRSGNIIVAPN